MNFKPAGGYLKIPVFIIALLAFCISSVGNANAQYDNGPSQGSYQGGYYSESSYYSQSNYAPTSPTWQGGTNSSCSNGRSRVFLDWNSSSYTDYYEIYRRELGNASWGNRIGVVGQSTTSYTDYPLNNTQYEYRIRARNDYGDAYSSTQLLTTANCTPPVISVPTLACYDSDGLSSSSSNTTTNEANVRLGAAARSFNGSNQYITIASTPNLNTIKDFTISFWIKPSTVSGIQAIISKLTDSSQKQYAISLDNGTIYVDYERDGNNAAVATTSNPIQTANTWYHIAVTLNSSLSPQIYVNGTLQSISFRNVTQFTETLKTDNPLVIGRWGGSYNDRYFSGFIDEVGFWNRVLTQGEITSLSGGGGSGTPPSYNSNLPPFNSLLAAYYPMDETTGNIVRSSAPYSSPYVGLRWDTSSPNIAYYNIYRVEDNSNSTGKFQSDTPGTLTDSILSYWKIDESSGTTVEDAIAGNTGYAQVGLPTNGLVSFWNFDETSGSSWADSVDGNTVSAVNGATQSSVNKAGGRSANFEGNNEYGRVYNNSNINLTKNFTIAAWVRPDSTSNISGIMTKLTDSNDKQYALSIDNGQLLFDYERSGNNESIRAGSIVADGNWYHVAGTVSNGSPPTIRAYLNGNQVGSKTVTETTATSNDLIFGAWRGTYDTYYLNGRIDEAGIWNRELSQPEIMGIYNNSSANNIVTPPNSKLGNARQYNGSSQYVQIPSQISLANSSFTISAWAKRDSTSSSDYIFSQGSSSQNNGLHFGFRNSTTFNCGFYANDLDVTVSSDTNWHLWTCTYDAATKERRIYRDGVEIRYAVSSANYQGSGGSVIGTTAWLSGADYFHGIIDEVGLWGRALTSAEVTRLYNGSAGNTYVLPTSPTIQQIATGVTSKNYLDKSVTSGSYYAYQVESVSSISSSQTVSPPSQWQWTPTEVPICEAVPPSVVWAEPPRACYAKYTDTSNPPGTETWVGSQPITSQAIDYPAGTASGVDSVIYLLQNVANGNSQTFSAVNPPPIAAADSFDTWEYTFTEADLEALGQINQQYRLYVRAVDKAGNQTLFSENPYLEFSYSDSCVKPWLQTTSGDVHTNTKIITPGGPTPAPGP